MESMQGTGIVTLHKASEADIQTLIALEKSVSGSTTYSPMLTESEWKEELKEVVVFLIKNDQKVVGNFSYQQKSPDHIYISGLVISPEHQGKGIARRVLTSFLFRHPEVKRIDLVTHPHNPALQLYLSLGFQIESQKDDYYGDGEPRLVLALTR